MIEINDREAELQKYEYACYMYSFREINGITERPIGTSIHWTNLIKYHEMILRLINQIGKESWEY